ncbi:single-stranded DNA-binding protein [Francisella sp. TX07-6608]|uniref:single-stranded DNA-binding protein n=1 Tax=Francisella sp. TX07-6608 TaxID=573568 RepID=UPI0008F9D7A4|nr:single-stranded DNA-binding protein [Francisella sp. TX07-6608]OIN85066.1 single-strand binding family protein [Francisella sp. TX07-6608]
MNDLLSGCFIKTLSQGRISRLGKHYNIGGKRIFKFSVAYNILQHVEYINYVAYDKHADYLGRYAKLGTFIYVESVPHTNRYKDKNNLEKYLSKTTHRVEALSFIANLKDTIYRSDQLSLTEIQQLQQSTQDIDAISIAKNVLQQAGYQIIKEH